MSAAELKSYTSYKKSGAEWMGDIPEHWNFTRIKNVISKITSGVTPRGGADSYVDVGIPFLRSQNVYNDGLHLDDVSFISAGTHLEMMNSQVKPGDIVFNITGASIARTCIVPETIKTANISQHIALLRLSKLNETKFISYYLQSQLVKDYVYLTQSGASKEAFNHGQMKCIPLPLPPRLEQKSIIAYLDIKTSQIDRQIEQLSKQVSHYEELRQSLINETIVRGLDKSVPMMDSGVKWIGEVPQAWTLQRHKDNFHFVTDRCVDASLLKVGLENIEGQTGRFIQTDSEFDGDGVEFKTNDILFGKLRPYLAKVYLAEFIGNAVGDIFVYRPKKTFTPRFAKYLMLSDRYIDVINGSTAGAKMPRVSSDFIANLPIATPPVSEQIAIATYLARKTAQVDRIVEAINSKIDKLGDLRKALINDVVTGKIRVVSEGQAT